MNKINWNTPKTVKDTLVKIELENNDGTTVTLILPKALADLVT